MPRGPSVIARILKHAPAADVPQTPGDRAPDRQPAAGAPLPADVRRRFNGELHNRTVLGWSPFDLDAHNRFARQFVVLTHDALLVLEENAPPSQLLLCEIEEVKLVEGLGVNRLRVLIDGKIAADLRHTNRHRREMTRLHRKVHRRLSGAPAAEQVPEATAHEDEQEPVCPLCGQFIPDDAEGVCPQCVQKRRVLGRLLDFVRPYRRQVCLAIALTFAASAMTVLPPIFTGRLIDDAVGRFSFARLGLWAACLVVAVSVNEIFSAARLRVLSAIGSQVTRDLRHRIYSHLHELSLRYFAKRRTGSLITRVTTDTDRLWEFIVFGSVDFFGNGVMIALTTIAMLVLNWRLALIALVPLPVVAALSFHCGMKMQRLWGRLWAHWARLTAVVGDVVPGVKVVKAFASERREVERFDTHSGQYADREIAVHRIWAGFGPSISAAMRLGAVGVWVLGGAMVIAHHGAAPHTLGMLVTFTSFVWQFYGPVLELANSNRMITRAATSAQRVFEVLDTPPEIRSRPNAITKARLEGRIEMRNVAFSYEGAAPALRDVSLHVEPGEMIGLCGPSGAGKSTFVNLLLRFYDVTDGQVLLDGVDIRDYDVKWLRREVGIVLQEPHLFHGSVADNIRYARPDADEDQVITAARAANAHDFIVGFPDGYDTLVGERGQSLSGGERQRISIARAILHDPRLLILDEATSSVDTETEKQIRQALDRLIAGRTTIAIAHRLSTLAAADRLVVLDKGRVVETGQHADLVGRKNGVYARLHRTQMETYGLPICDLRFAIEGREAG
ncbi:MAG: transporter ATP-binding protein [Phycisphaerales bacterium]|nr:transporter ATP-binding protein [Phycisphaerales bacterium]